MKKISYCLLVIVLLIVVSCAPKRWTKDDPMAKEPDTSDMTIEDSIEIGIGTNLTPTPTATVTP